MRTSIHCSLLPDCGCGVTSCLQLPPLCLPRRDELYPQTTSWTDPPSFSCPAGVSCHRNRKSDRHSSMPADTQPLWEGPSNASSQALLMTLSELTLHHPRGSLQRPPEWVGVRFQLTVLIVTKPQVKPAARKSSRNKGKTPALGPRLVDVF